jgi:hypothetical protein
MTQVLNLKILKAVLTKAIEDYERIHQRTELVLDSDLYWQVDDDDLLNMSGKPGTVVGSLQDDWRSLSEAIYENRTVGSESLTKLSGILHWLSCQID